MYCIARNIGVLYMVVVLGQTTVKKYWRNLNLVVVLQVCLPRNVAVLRLQEIKLTVC